MDSSASWSQYWSQGHKTSFGSHFAGSYEGVLKDSWIETLLSLKPESEVLDLCTGNASIIRLANNNTNNFHQVRYTGVDYASLDIEDELLALPNVNLHFNIDVADLPLPSKYYDLIISNFGIEYSDIKKSLAEVRRVLKVGGSFEFICHHVDSHVIKSSLKELKLLDKIFEPSNALDCLKNLITELELVGEGKANDSAEVYRGQLNECLFKLAEQFSSDFYNCDFLSFLKYVLRPNVKNKLGELSSFKHELSSYKVRIDKMVNAAFNVNKLDSFVKLGTQIGFVDILSEEIRDNDGVVGLRITGKLTQI